MDDHEEDDSHSRGLSESFSPLSKEKNRAQRRLHTPLSMCIDCLRSKMAVARPKGHTLGRNPHVESVRGIEGVALTPDWYLTLNINK
jgi:hypothetical protein